MTTTSGRIDAYTKAVLTVIAILLVLLIARPAANPPAVQAQTQTDALPLHIEPGTAVVRNPDGGSETQGKVVIDRRSGEIWGFPTDTLYGYPVNPMGKTPPPVRPIYLGKLDFSSIRSR